MGKIRFKKKLAVRYLIFLSAFFIFSPILINAQDVNISVSAEVNGTSTPPIPPETPGGGGWYVPPETEIILKGRAYPLAIVTILKNNAVIASFKAEQSGMFERGIKGISGGIYDFSIFAEDTEGRKSETLSFKVTILENRITTVSGIFIPSTISLASQLAEQGEKINIFGQVFPASKVRILVSPSDLIKETIASSQGKWSFDLETDSLKEGEYKVKTKSFFGEGEQSGFSQELSFKITKKAEACSGADLNIDGKVDLVDFSILLYFWEQTKPANRCADINSDGIVDIVDFSIMMYQWTE
ncbi:MAG: dockerin type I repeat-containing protein [Bacteroidia bacterium]|nr:dockerin type I repeat-containing protein [Bacteroidia bacterium]